MHGTPSSSLDPANLARIFKAYDVRGRVPDQLDAALARAVGNAAVAVLTVDGTPPQLVVGHDMRVSSPEIAAAVAEGAAAAGARVTLVGLASTDLLYFASGHLGVPGVMVTASHNPAQDNGLKLCHAFAAPVSGSTGLTEIRDRVADGSWVEHGTGSVETADLLAAYAEHVRGLAPVTGRRLTVVVDAGNGMAGHTAPAVLGQLDVDLVPLYFELDGSFPNHEANPIDPENLRDLQAAVVAHGADLGLAFDGDADRCFVVDERGDLVGPSALTALIATRELAREPGATVIYNLISSRAVPEIIAAHGGVPVRSRVGHSFIKGLMAETGAIFGGEHSGHYYFRDFWRADSGMLAALHTLAALAEHDAPLSELIGHFSPFVASGEVNSVVPDQDAALRLLEDEYSRLPGVTLDRLDGLTVSHADWWFNVRPSNTEPLLRLNVEGVDQESMAAVREQVLGLIRSES